MELKCGIPRKKYDRIHSWLRRNYGKANKCESNSCSGKSEFYEWAKKKGCDYKKDRNNFIMLCKLCHNRYDGIDSKNIHSLRDKETMKRIQEAKYKPIKQFTKDGEFVRLWKSATHAGEQLDISRKAINNNIYNRSKSAGGFVWELDGYQ